MICNTNRNMTTARLFSILLVICLMIMSFPAMTAAELLVDKTALTAAIDAQYSDGAARTTRELPSSAYTVESYTAYDNAILAGIAVEVNVEATQVEVDTSAAAISTTRTALVLKNLTITFNSQNGSLVASKTAVYGALITAPAAPVKSGCIFGGWYRESACTTAWNFSSDTVQGDMTLYAKWTAASKYAITLQSNNAIYGTVTGGGLYANDKVTKATITAIPKPYYRFYRWLEGSTAISVNYQLTFFVTRARTFTAEFVKINAPTLTAASAGYNQVKLNWTAVSGAVGYEIWRAGSSTGKYALITTVTSTSYVNTGLTTNATYYYKVRAKCTAGSCVTYSPCSTPKSAKPIPSTPANVKAASASYSSVKLTWGAVAGATKYEIYRATSATGTYAKITETTGLSYTNSGLTAGKIYYYKIRAFKMVGITKVCGIFCSPVNAKPIPVTPSGFAAASVPYGVYLKWSSVAGATKYSIYRATSKTGTYKLVTETDKLNYTNTGLSVGTTYYFKIRAYKLVGTTKVYSILSTSVNSVPRYAQDPAYAIYNSGESETNVKYVCFGITNYGTKTMRIYSAESCLVDDSNSSYDRNLHLVDLEYGDDISSVDIPAGETVLVLFRVVGDATRYNQYACIYYDFLYDTIRYEAYASYYYENRYGKHP